MKVNIQKAVKGATLFICILSLLLINVCGFASAAVETHVYAEVTVKYLNVREGPGLNYPVVTQYFQGERFYANAGDYIEADGYKWYVCPDGFIAQTGGLKFVDYTTYTDTLIGYDMYGVQKWHHICTNVTEDTEYYFEVGGDYYEVRCDCGWWTYVECPKITLNVGTAYETPVIFLGLDTDNDERIDLRPGDTARIPTRAFTSARDLLVTEFYGDEFDDTPSVTINVRDADGNILHAYDFHWGVHVSTGSSSIVFEDFFGNQTICYIEPGSMVYDSLNDFFLSEEPHWYSIKGAVDPLLRHWTVDLVVTSVEENPVGLMGFIVKYTREIFGSFHKVFDFFNLSFIFTDENSPIYFIFNLPDSIAHFYSAVGSFFDALPPHLIAICAFPFIAAVVVGLMRWFK